APCSPSSDRSVLDGALRPRDSLCPAGRIGHSQPELPSPPRLRNPRQLHWRLARSSLSAAALLWSFAFTSGLKNNVLDYVFVAALRLIALIHGVAFCSGQLAHYLKE